MTKTVTVRDNAQGPRHPERHSTTCEPRQPPSATTKEPPASGRSTTHARLAFFARDLRRFVGRDIRNLVRRVGAPGVLLNARWRFRHLPAFEIQNNHFLLQEAPRPAHVWLIAADGKSAARRLTSGAWTLPV